jgi:COMPASS component SWD3
VPAVSDATHSREILGVSATASAAEIKAAYRQLAKQWHPDRFVNSAEYAIAEAKLKQINLAYECLKAESSESDVTAENNPQAAQNQTAQAQTAKSPAKTQFQRTPKTPQNYFEQAIQAIAQRRYDDAVVALDQAIKLDAEYIEAFAQRAIAYGKLGQEEKALRDRVRADLLTERARKAARNTPPQPAAPRPSDHRQPVAPPSPSNRIILPDAQMAMPWPIRAEFAVAPDSISTIGRRGKLLANGASNGNVTLWNLNTQCCFANLPQHRAPITALAFTQDESLLVTADQAGCIGIWHVATATLLRSTIQPSPVTSLVLTPEHEIISGGVDGRIYRWQIQSAQLKHKAVQGTRPIVQLALNHNGQVCAVADAAGQVRSWPRTFQHVRVSFASELPQVKAVVAQGVDGWLTLDGQAGICQWSSQGQAVAQLQLANDTIEQMALHPDQATLAIGCGSWVRFWHLGQRRVVADLALGERSALEESAVRQLMFTSDGGRLIVQDQRGLIRVYETPD